MRWNYWSEDSGDGWHTVRVSYYRQLVDEHGTPRGDRIEISYEEYCTGRPRK